tara:strand:- start:2014 stop:7104 length:5091 start_codon:yes stop_codon:yes gene_type:complete
MVTKEEIVPSTEEPIPVEDATFDDQGLAPEEFPEAGPDPFVAAEEDIIQEDVGTLGIDPEFKIPLEDTGEEHEDGLMRLPAPPPPPPTAQSQQQAKETSYYATQELGLEGQDAETRFAESKDQLITEGRSALEEEAKAAAKESDRESDSLAVDSIISDSSLSSDFRKTVLTTYLQSGLLPLSLKERYINRQTVPEPKALITTVANQDSILARIDIRKNNQHGRVRQKEINSVPQGYWDSFAGGWSFTVDRISETTGIGETTPEEIRSGIQEQRRVSKLGTLHGVVQGLGEIGPPLVVAVGAGVLAPVSGASALTTAGVVFLAGGTTQALSHYSQLSAEGVDEETRMIAALQEGLFFGVETSLPFLKAANFVKSIILNGGATITFSQLSVAAQNRILEGYPELQREQFNIADMTVEGLMGGFMGAVFSGRGLKKVSKPSRTELDEDVGVPASSVADSDKVANPDKAAKESAEVIGKEDGATADVKYGGNGVSGVAHDWVNPKTYKMSVGDETPMNPDTATEMNEWFSRADSELNNLFEETRFDPNLQDADVRLRDIQTIHKIHQDNGGPKYNQPNSQVSITHTASEGQDIFTPRSGGVYKTLLGAQREMKKLQKSIEATNPNGGVFGIVDKDGGYVIGYDWKFDYGALDVGTLGVQPIRILGKDVTALSRSKIGNFLFATGRHLGMEGPAFRAIERQARIANTFDRQLNSAIRELKNKEEFNTLINDAEELGKDHYTIRELEIQFPNLKRAEVENLAVTWAKWRRVIDYQHNFVARQDRQHKYDKGYRGVYKAGKGKPIGMASDRIDPAELAKMGRDANSYVWDFDLGRKVKYDKKLFEKNGNTVVKMFETMGGKGESFEYGILSSNVKLHHLPDITLPKIEGYSPRVTKENFFIDMHPKESRINGIKETDPNVLYDKLKTTHGATRTRAEGNQMKAQLELDNPDMIITVRRERMNKAEQIAEAMKVQGSMLREARRRGERLQSMDGPARIEDRLVSLQRSIDNLATTEAFTQWDMAVQKSFLDRYSEFVEGGLFPSEISQISIKGIPDKANEIKFQEALRNFEYYSMMKQMKTYGDFQWEAQFHAFADLLEDFTVKWNRTSGVLPKISKDMARDLPDAFRKIGDQGNLLTKFPKQLGSALYIHLNVPRQWVIQPAQVREMWVVNPATAGNSFRNAQAMRFMISTMDDFQNVNMKVVRVLADKKLSGLSEKQLLEDFKAIKRSGLLDSLDRNELVRDVFNDSQAMLMESGWQKAGRRGQNTFTKPIGLARKVGFDVGEMHNRLGMWYQARSLWQKQNPNKDWRTLKNQETIALEGTRLSGGMSRAGSLPYQRGAASVLFQFMAIGHKLTLNTLQDSATIMPAPLRAKLAAARLTTYGFHAGLPASALLAWSYDLFNGEPLFDDEPELRRILEHGVGEYAVNNLIQAIWDEKGEGKAVTDLSFSEGLSPYSPHGLPYISTAIEWYKLIDGQGSTNPRMPITSILGSVGKTVNNIQALSHIQKLDAPEHLTRAVHEVLQLGSMYKNITKAVIMHSTANIQSSNGHDLGSAISVSEAFFKAWGFRTHKEIDNWDGVLSVMELKQVEKDLTDGIYKQWVFISNIIDTTDAAAKTQALSSLFSVIEDGKILGPEAKSRIMDAVLSKDIAAYKSGRQSLLAELYKHNHETVNGPMKRLSRIVQDSQDPEMKEWFKLWKNRDGL